MLDGDENAVYLLDGSVNAFLYEPQIVFTSSHGMDQWAKGELFVNNSSGQRSRVDKILMAPGFKDRLVTKESIAAGNSVGSRSNDFAILILAEPLPMTQKVDLIKINDLSDIIRNQEPVYSIGYSSYDKTRKKDQRPRQLEAKMIEKELAKTIAVLDETRPGGNKVEAVIPTKSGYHLITKRFDVDMFRKSYPQVDIQKKNPTLLYFPNSLD